MTPAKFNELAENIEEIGNAWIDRVAQEAGSGSLRWDQAWKEKIRRAYEQDHKASVKLLSVDDEKAILDRHKVATAITLAILDKSPLIASPGSKHSRTVREANGLLAIDAGGMVLFAFGVTEAMKTANQDLGKIYDPQSGGFVFPEPGNGECTYQEHFCQTCRLTNNQIPPLFLSNIFFLLQRNFEAIRAYEFGLSPEVLDYKLRRTALAPFLATAH